MRIGEGVRGAVSACAACAALLSARQARADKFARTLDLSLHGQGGWVAPPSLALRGGGEGLTLSGVGQQTGAFARGGLGYDGLRLGVGVGAFSARLLEVSGAGARLDGSALGYGGEAFAGYAFGQPRGVRPYAELRASFTWLRASVALAEGTEALTARSAGLGPRAGLMFPLSEYFFGDVGIGAGLLGPERVTLSLGIGLPIPLDNL